MESALIGRHREMAALHRLLGRDGVALVSVTGPGGIGKTRLALEVARHVQARYEHGVAVVHLASVREPEFVAATLAKELGLEGQRGQPPLQWVKGYLRERRLLLVLDNFEQVVQAAPMIAELLGEARGLKVLVTSRMRLHIAGEHEYALGTLELPTLPVRDAGQAAGAAAVSLFTQRAQAVRPEFVLDEGNIGAVAAICVRLDGWPLAIELAASRVKLLPPQALLQRLQQRLGLLTGGPVDRPQRQRTMRGTLDWSHDLLQEPERDLFATLGVFNGGATLEAIESVCGDGTPGLLERLETLVEHSLVLQQDGRFRMLETLHEYAAAKLEEQGRGEVCRRLHARYFLALAEPSSVEWRGARQREWFARLSPELDNFREALHWSLRAGRADLALRLSSALGLFWMIRGLAMEGRRWIESALAADGREPGVDHARALGMLGELLTHLDDMPAAVARLEASLAIFRSIEPEPNAWAAWAYISLGMALIFKGDHAAARKIFDECVEMTRVLQDTSFEIGSLYGLGTLESELGNFSAARPLLERALVMSQVAGDVRKSGLVLGNLGHLAAQEGRIADARAFIEQSLAAAESVGGRSAAALQRCNLGDVLRREGDLPGACASFVESLTQAHEVGAVRTACMALHNLALVLVDAGSFALGARLLAAAARHVDSYGVTPFPGTRLEYEQAVRALEERLGARALEQALTEGRSLSMPQAVELARAIEIAPVPAAVSEATRFTGLTGRELDVLRLVARGLSDRQVGENLKISTATASKHVANLLGKSMQRNRLALSLWAIARGLVSKGAHEPE